MSTTTSVGGSGTAGSNGALGTGIDVTTTVASLMQVARQPEALLQKQQTTLNAQSAALASINASLSSLQSAVQNLTVSGSQLTANAISTSNSSLVTASADGTATAGNHQITIANLASTSSFYTNAVTNSSTTLATGSFNISVGGGTAVPITVDATNNTLDGLAKTINAASAGVTASVITDSNGARLSIQSSTSGAAGEVIVSPFAATAGATAPQLSFTEAIVGKNASLQVDGIPISSSSNKVQNVIPGVTLNLQAVTTAPVSLSVTPDTSAATAAIQSFVSSYNSVMQQINTQSTFTSGAATPPLFGDSSLALVQQQMLSAVSYFSAGNGAIGSLRSLGVNMNNDGTLTVDSATLTNALTANNPSVQSFFKSAGTGFADQFSATLQTMTDPTQGAISVEINGNTTSVGSLQQQISDFEVRMTSYEAQLNTQYDAMNVTLQQMPLLLGQVNSQLASLG
jgi:flagellar hook-associated protein 2